MANMGIKGSMAGFNSRAHEGRDASLPSKACIHSCFNSRAHEGRDAFVWPFLDTNFVSIHAPTRGATCCRSCSCHGRRRFQFTRPRGARLAAAFSPFTALLRFNSRAHAGRDMQER